MKLLCVVISCGDNCGFIKFVWDFRLKLMGYIIMKKQTSIENAVVDGDANDNDEDGEGLDTRGMISAHNKKRKKSGGFQSMGKFNYVQFNNQSVPYSSSDLRNLMYTSQ